MSDGKQYSIRVRRTTFEEVVLYVDNVDGNLDICEKDEAVKYCSSNWAKLIHQGRVVYVGRSYDAREQTLFLGANCDVQV